MKNSLFALFLYLWMFLPDLKLQNERVCCFKEFFAFPQMMMHNIRANAALKCR